MIKNYELNRERKKYKIQGKHGTSTSKLKVKCHLTSPTGKTHAITANAFQFPKRLVLTMTGHKMQGQTVKRG